MTPLKLILHIGTEKTGTTHLQNLMVSNENILKKEGIHLLACAGIGNNRKLPSYCLENGNFDEYLRSINVTNEQIKDEFDLNLEKDLESEINSLDGNINTVVISSEHFHSRVQTTPEIQKGYNLFKKYFGQIELVCYLREQASVCQSSYSTSIRSGSTTPLNEYMSWCNTSNSYFDYLSFISKWKEVYIEENLNINVYEKSRFLNQDLVVDFFSKLKPGLEKKISKSITKSNESLNNLGQLLSLAINQTIPKETANGSLNPAFSNVFEIINSYFSGSDNLLSQEQYDKIFFHFYDDNVQLNKLLFNSNAPLFEYTPPISENFDDYSDNKNRAKAISGLVKLITTLNSSTFQPNYSDGDLLRDIALEYEERDLKKSLSLMLLASRFKPNGQFIRDKIVEIEEKLSNQ
mgnify:CR=1 FL=1